MILHPDQSGRSGRAVSPTASQVKIYSPNDTQAKYAEQSATNMPFWSTGTQGAPCRKQQAGREDMGVGRERCSDRRCVTHSHCNLIHGHRPPRAASEDLNGTYGEDSRWLQNLSVRAADLAGVGSTSTEISST